MEWVKGKDSDVAHCLYWYCKHICQLCQTKILLKKSGIVILNLLLALNMDPLATWPGLPSYGGCMRHKCISNFGKSLYHNFLIIISKSCIIK